MKSESFGYIHKETPVIRRTKKLSSLNRLGPGIYRHEKNVNTLSTHKRSQQMKFSPFQEKERLKFKPVLTPGPGKYNLNSTAKLSNFSGAMSYKISQTKRSTIDFPSETPGPAHYYLSKATKTSSPTIQYKFVYGHPT